MTDSLNIEWHVKRMVLRALNVSAKQFEAAALLGISERTLARYKKNFNIRYDKERDEFYFKGDRAVVIAEKQLM